MSLELTGRVELLEEPTTLESVALAVAQGLPLSTVRVSVLSSQEVVVVVSFQPLEAEVEELQTPRSLARTVRH